MRKASSSNWPAAKSGLRYRQPSAESRLCCSEHDLSARAVVPIVPEELRPAQVSFLSLPAMCNGTYPWLHHRPSRVEPAIVCLTISRLLVVSAVPDVQRA